MCGPRMGRGAPRRWSDQWLVRKPALEGKKKKSTLQIASHQNETDNMAIFFCENNFAKKNSWCCNRIKLTQSMAWQAAYTYTQDRRRLRFPSPTLGIGLETMSHPFASDGHYNMKCPSAWEHKKMPFILGHMKSASFLQLPRVRTTLDANCRRSS